MARLYESDIGSSRPVGPSLARADTANALADALGSFRQMVSQYGSARQTRRGEAAGAEVEGTPQLKSNLTAFGRAFNDAAIRNYVISKYTEMEVEIGRLEVEAGSDLDKFTELTKGLRKGAISGALPEARGDLSVLYERRIGEGTNRIAIKRAEEQKMHNKALLERGLNAVSDSISRKMASGDPVLMGQAQEEEGFYAVMIAGAVASGDLTPAEGVGLEDEGRERVTKNIVFGLFENEVKNGDPVSFISRIMKQPIENLSDEEKQAVVGDLFVRLNRNQALVTEDLQQEQAEREKRWMEGDQEATLAMLRGQLTIGALAKLVERDELSPAVARTLQNELQSGKSGVDDPRLKFMVETDLLGYTEEEIGKMGGLSYDTRANLILKRREESETWRNEQGAQEALRRIDLALGIPEGLNAMQKIGITEEKANAAARARSYFYDLIEALPEEERNARMFEMASKAVGEVGKDVKRVELDRARKSLERYKADHPLGSLDEQERKDYETDVARREARIRSLEQEVAK